MKELPRKPGDEMLVVHKPAAKAEPDKAGRERGDAARASAHDKEEFELMRRQLALAKDAGEKRRLLAEIQRRFGNEKAGQLVHDLPAPKGRAN